MRKETENMGLASAVDWWEEWQLRVLVLSSLALRWLLFLWAPLRKLAIPSPLRFLIWIIYLGSDAVAIYALATLFNRHKESGVSFASGDTRVLEVVWAPILLLHLAGLRSITAYNIEDNELWLRHVVTAVSQITVAIYVFCKSWPAGGDKRLWEASILLFFAGINSFLFRPMFLQFSSVNGQSSRRPARTEAAKRYENRHGRYCLLESFVREASSIIQDSPCQSPGIPVALEPRMLILDFLPRYPDRLELLRSFLMDTSELHKKLQIGLSVTFDSLYTIQKGVKIWSGPRKNLLQVIAEIDTLFKLLAACVIHTIFPFVALGLFHISHKISYIGEDVTVTYTLLCGTAVLVFFDFAFAHLEKHFTTVSRWPENVAQHSLIRFFVRKESKWIKLLRRSLQCTVLLLVKLWSHSDLFLQPLYTLDSQGPSSSRAIIELVDAHLKVGWREYIQDAASYRKFNALMGQWTLERNNCGENQILSESLEIPFDESVLLWHIATDFCFYAMGASRDHHCATAQCRAAWCERYPHHARAVGCREISNYMMPLLYDNPEMLMVGSRQYLFTEAYAELKVIFGYTPFDDPIDLLATMLKNIRSYKPPAEERELTRKITEKVMESGQGSKESYIYDAWALARGLLDLDDEKKMWEVIEGVWVEMLCFSASRCRGYLHAKALGKGGELLTYIWLLMSYMGMETLAERLQRSERRSRRGKTSEDPSTSDVPIGCAPPSTFEDPTSAAPSTSEAPTAAGPSTSEVPSGAAASTSEIRAAAGDEIV